MHPSLTIQVSIHVYLEQLQLINQVNWGGEGEVWLKKHEQIGQKFKSAWKLQHISDKKSTFKLKFKSMHHGVNYITHN